MDKIDRYVVRLRCTKAAGDMIMAGAFKKLEAKLNKKGLPGGDREAKAIAAIQGRKSLGQKEMTRRSVAGRKKSK